MTARIRKTRTVVRYRFDPAPGSADLPDRFVLKMDTEHQEEDRRTADGWTTVSRETGVILTPEPLTRNQLAGLVGDGASMLAYLGDELS